MGVEGDCRVEQDFLGTSILGQNAENRRTSGEILRVSKNCHCEGTGCFPEKESLIVIVGAGRQQSGKKQSCCDKQHHKPNPFPCSWAKPPAHETTEDRNGLRDRQNIKRRWLGFARRGDRSQRWLP